MKTVAAGLLILACLAGCRAAPGDDAAEGAVRAPVATALVRRDSMAEELEVIGSLRPSPGHSAQLTAPVAGVVAESKVQAGDRVTPGQLLLVLDVPELEATAANSEVAAQVAERDASRQRGLLEQGVASRRTVEEKEALARSARADASSAAAQLARASLRSPIAGQIQQVRAQVGERVEAGAPLVEVVDPSSLDLAGAIPATAMARIHPGQPVSITIEGLPGTLPGLVHAVAPALDSASHSGMVIIRLRNRTSLPAGIGARALVRVGVLRDVLVIPDSALVVVGDSEATFEVGPDSIARRRTVVILARNGGWVAVAGELKPGASVVTTGAWGLADGMHVLPGGGAPAP